MVAHAKERLGTSGVKVASLATAFPSGRAKLEIKLADTATAVEAGADEIDMVIDRGAFLAGRYLQVYDEIVSVKRMRQGASEGDLRDRRVANMTTSDEHSSLAMIAGADFIKTSTGRVAPAATLPVTLVMLEAVRDFHLATGNMVGKGQAWVASKRQGCHQMARHGQRGGGPTMAYPRLVPLRRLDSPQRPTDATHQTQDRPLQRPRLLHLGLSLMTPSKDVARTAAAFEYAPARSNSIATIRPHVGLFIDGATSAMVQGVLSRTINPATEEVLSEVSEGHRG